MVVCKVNYVFLSTIRIAIVLKSLPLICCLSYGLRLGLFLRMSYEHKYEYKYFPSKWFKSHSTGIMLQGKKNQRKIRNLSIKPCPGSYFVCNLKLSKISFFVPMVINSRREEADSSKQSTNGNKVEEIPVSSDSSSVHTPSGVTQFVRFN